MATGGKDGADPGLLPDEGRRVKADDSHINTIDIDPGLSAIGMGREHIGDLVTVELQAGSAAGGGVAAGVVVRACHGNGRP